MSRSAEDQLVLSSRYIHTGNSGVTLTLRRDIKRTDRAELEVENGAFGAFRTSLLVRGNSYEGMTAIQLRDLALMFLDAADALDKNCQTPLKQGGFSSLLGDGKADIVAEGGGRRRDGSPKSLLRYIPGELSGIALKPDIDLTKFAEVYNERTTSRGAKTMTEETRSTASKESKAQRQARYEKTARKDFILKTGWDYLLAKRLLDCVTPFHAQASSDHKAAPTVKFVTEELDEEESYCVDEAVDE